MARHYAKTPTVYQMEATECGAASLSMILGYYGRYVPLEQMRIETGVSRDGCNANNIVRAGKKFGLEVHGLRKDLDGLFKLPVPCILYWNFNHFVVWEGRKGDYYIINDPAIGRRKLTLNDIDQCYTGIVLTFEPTSEFKRSKKPSTLLAFIMDRLKSEYSVLAALVVMGLFLVLPGLLIPIFSQIFIDTVLLDGQWEWMPALTAVMLGTFIVKFLLSWFRGRTLISLQKKMMLISSQKMLAHLLRLPISFFDQRYAGDLSQRVTNNNNVNMFLTSDLAENILNCFVAAFYLILLFIYSPLLTAIGLLFTTVNLVLMASCARAIKDVSIRSQQEQGKLVGTLFSGLSVTDTLKASGSENEFISRLLGNYAKNIQMEQVVGLRQELLNAIPSVSNQLLTVATLVVGGILVIRGDMTSGMLVAYTGLMSSFSAPVSSLAGFIQRIQTMKADMNRVDDVMKYKEDVRFSNVGKQIIDTKLTGQITLEGISFGYNVLENPLIEDFEFNLESGQSIAFVGESGSGKSTVAKICSGLYIPWSGQLWFDGVDSKDIPVETFFSSVSTVSQEITIFSGTVRDNLTMWNRYIDDADMINAAKDACIHDVITSKPGAYDYELSEGGSELSGGQKQRLEIARALATNPSIIVMDEATSALDPITEKKVIDNIKKRGCTCIIVAHRLSAIRDCDEIIVMSQGKVVQRGTHEELAQIEGHYKNLIRNI
ncbi:MAG: NHLP family bacteriocin export ABC transporter peptidase/permease/ATPase subunit [Lachnospiraceae bacterium]|nr:NHLP family bacteriocin export ABC transporter peptidase/permease/ATPase subunit [Lachnospiraceae bacterium]